MNKQELRKCIDNKLYLVVSVIGESDSSINDDVGIDIEIIESRIDLNINDLDLEDLVKANNRLDELISKLILN